MFYFYKNLVFWGDLDILKKGSHHLAFIILYKKIKILILKKKYKKLQKIEK